MRNDLNTQILNKIKEKINLEYCSKSINTQLIVQRITNNLGNFSLIDIKKFIFSMNEKKISTINTTKYYTSNIIDKIKNMIPLQIYDYINKYCEIKKKEKKNIIQLPDINSCTNFFNWLIIKEKKIALIFKIVLETGLKISEIKNINLKKSIKKNKLLYLHYIDWRNKKENYAIINKNIFNNLKEFGNYPFLDIDLTSFSTKLKKKIIIYNKENSKNFPIISIEKIRYLNINFLIKNKKTLSNIFKNVESFSIYDIKN